MARWPKYIPQETAATAAVSTPLHTKGGRNPYKHCPGNLKPIKGTKYSKLGGFVNTQNFGGVREELAAILTKASNFSLATSTWKSYSSCMKMIHKMEKELGQPLRDPMSEQVILMILALLIKRGLKTTTIM